MLLIRKSVHLIDAINDISVFLGALFHWKNSITGYLEWVKFWGKRADFILAPLLLRVATVGDQVIQNLFQILHS